MTERLKQDILEIMYDHAELRDQDGDYNGKCLCGWRQEGFEWGHPSDWNEHVTDELLKFLKEKSADLIVTMRKYKFSDAEVTRVGFEPQRKHAWNQGIENAILSVKEMFGVTDDTYF